MNKQELTEVLQGVDLETLGRWYCDLNCFRKPEGFPIDLGEVDRAHREAPLFRMAWECVSDRIGETFASRAWWVHQLGRTESEWFSWWNGGLRNGPSPALNEASCD